MANRKANKEKPNQGEPDAYDRDLERDSRRATEGISQREPDSNTDREPDVGQQQLREGMGPENFQKDRTGQAQSPVEQNLNQPPKEKKPGGR